MISVVSFDADDTLWHNERHYTEAKASFRNLLTKYHSSAWIDERLDRTELQNLNRYGYGIKSFTLSMIETAIDLTEGRITGEDVKVIIGLAWEMLSKPMQVLEGVEETIQKLAGRYRLLMVTKGDLFEQESKIARSGLGEQFSGIEIVSEKTPEAYRGILTRHGVAPDQFLMVGNSLKSDVLPVLRIGARAVHIPFETTWVHEMVDEAELSAFQILRLDKMADLPALLEKLES